MVDGASNDGASSSHGTAESSDSAIEINIKTLDSQVYTFRVTKNMQVSVLKEKIVNATGIPIEHQRLIFRGKVLKDDHLLSAYNLENEHTLHLVERQPVQAQASTGTGSEGSARNNANQGDESTGAPRSRIGQVSHSVVLGTVNIADPGEGMVADIGRLVGAVLNSFGVGNLASNGEASNTSSATSNQASPSVEAEGTQNAGSGPQPTNPAQPGFTILNHPFQSLQIPQISRLTAIPDSLATLSEFISRMELALHHGGSQSSPPNNVQDPPRSEVPSSNSRGLPTPEALGALMEQVQQLLTGNAAAVISNIAARLRRESASSDPVVRGQVQSEAMHAGVAMQHLGAMFLELGRTMMTLRMGQSAAEAVVNAGPAVYISPTGPNPIMVQPFPLQSSSLFGVPPSSLLSGAPGPFGSGGTSRNVNIHIHTVTPGVSSVGTRVNLGEAIRGDRSNMEQANPNGNGSSDAVPVRGLPSRTVVARSGAESGSHVLSVVYPVHVRPQLSVPVNAASTEASISTANIGIQPNASTPVPQPSSESAPNSTFVDQLTARLSSAFAGQPSSNSVSNTALSNHLSAQIASALAGIIPGQNLSNLSIGSSTGIQGSRPSMTGGAQSNIPSSASFEIPIGSMQITAQLRDTLSNISHDERSPPSVECTDASHPIEAHELLQRGSAPSDGVNFLGDNSEDTASSDRNGSCESQEDKQELIPGGVHLSNSRDSQESSVKEVSSTAKSMDDPSFRQASDKVSSSPMIGPSEKNLNPIPTGNTSGSSQGSGSDRSAPLGLGLGGLQPKKRSKPAKPIGKDDALHGMPSTNDNQQSIARAQQLLHSLVSQSSDRSSVNPNGSSIPVPSVFSQIMDEMPLGIQGSSDQVDSGNMISHALQTPALNNLLTGVAEQTGFGSPAVLRNMVEQFTRNPAVMNTMNEIVQQVGQNEDIGGMLSGLGRGQGGLDLSRMIQQMMPVVSQALGRGGSTNSPPVQSRNVILDNDRSAQINFRGAVERIEQHDPPRDVFHAVLESAGGLLGEEDCFGDVVEELADDMELTSEFMEMLQRQLRSRLEGESPVKHDES